MKVEKKYPEKSFDHFKYVILENKDFSWLQYYMDSVDKSERQSALELALLDGNVSAADYILTYYKKDILNSVTYYDESNLYLNSFVGHYLNYSVSLKPERSDSNTEREYHY